VEFKGNAVAFLDQSTLESVGLSEPAFTILVVVTMIAFGVVANKDFLDAGRGVLDVLAMFVDIVEE
jgi:hypothetical protein